MLPYARYRQFRRCPDKVRLGAARGDPGEVRREAHWSLIQPVDCGTFHPARTERLFRDPARCLVSLCLSPAKRLASTRTTQLVCCRARLRLSSAREAHVAQAAANAPSRCSHPRGQSIPAPASLPTVPERPLPATPAVGPTSPSQLCTRSSGCGSRLLRLCLSACSARQAAHLHACRRAPHIRVRLGPLHGRCCSSTAIATSALLTHWQSFTGRLQAANPIL